MPPSVRNRGAAGMGDSMHRREENSVRVTNLSEDTREEDLRVSLTFRLIRVCATVPQQPGKWFWSRHASAPQPGHYTWY